LGKIVLIVLVFVAVYFIVRGYARSLTGRVERRPPRPDEDMVRCRHCGVHLPRGESVISGDAFFCSEEHRKLDVR
jgi:uncharacterized protein